jgi:hypothetical protein
MRAKNSKRLLLFRGSLQRESKSRARVPVLPRPYVCLHYQEKSRVANERCDSRDGHREGIAAGLENTVRLTKNTNSVTSLGEVVERPEYQHCIAGGIAKP